MNNYCAFFYIAVKMKYTPSGCPEGGCTAMLRFQISLTLSIITGIQVLVTLLQVLQVRYKLYAEERALQSDRNYQRPVKRTFMEEQAKYGSFRTEEQIIVFNDLVISLGFVVIFGSVSPIMIPLGLFVFAGKEANGAWRRSSRTPAKPEREGNIRGPECFAPIRIWALSFWHVWAPDDLQDGAIPGHDTTFQSSMK